MVLAKIGRRGDGGRRSGGGADTVGDHSGAPASRELAAGEVDDRPLGVYVHFPYCSVHCPYCDFAVDTSSPIPHDQYADAVSAEIAARAPWFFRGDGRPLSLRSIYFGGGTPGLWRSDALGRVVAAACVTFGTPVPRGDGAGDLEITVEANPGEITVPQLTALRAVGVNRLSLGAQSFEDGLLRKLGRNHDAAAISGGMSAARSAGFDNVSCDLIFGIPGQSLAQWESDVAALVALAPEHVSSYALTIERGTRFGALDRAGKLARPDDEAVAVMYEHGRGALAQAGYSRYEVSSHARPGRRAVHNSLYWSGAAYLGVGASAASFRPLAGGSGAWRFTNPRATPTYLRAVAEGQGNPRPARREWRSRSDLENEAVWLGLRTSDGIARVAHGTRFGCDPLASPARAAAASGCVDAGWLIVEPEVVRLSTAGFLFADEVASRLWLGD